MIVLRIATVKTLAIILFQLVWLRAVAQPSVSELKLVVSENPDSSDLYLQIAKHYLFNTPDSAYDYIRKAIGSADGTDLPAMAEGQKLMGIWHDLQAAYDSSIYYYTLAGELYQQADLSQGYGDVLNNIAYTRTKQGSYKEALEDYYQALEIYNTEGAISKAGRTLINIGIVFQQTDDLNQALKMYLQAIENTTELNDQRTYITASSNIATIHTRRGEYKKAIPIYDSLIAVLKLQNNDRGLSLNYNNLAQAYTNIGEYDLAQKNYMKSIALKRKMNDRQGLANAYQNLAELYLKTQVFPEASNYIDSSLLISGDLGDLSLYTEAKRVASLIAYEGGNDAKASHSFIEYLTLRDSLDVVEQTKVVQELSKKYENEQQQKKIIELELDKKTSALALVSSRNQRNTFVFGFITVFIFAGFLFYRYHTKKKMSELLTRKNFQISRALDERETLLKEIHHRVKNNLQVISSLLNLQAGSLSDAAAIDAVREGQNRVKSMALIHQKLYSAEDIRGVDVQDYFENLTIELFQAFGVDEEKIQYAIETNNLKLDIDTVIPLGLIVNELITNTLKYAFGPSEGGLLKIWMQEKEGKLHVAVKDNGKGIRAGKLEEANSFGWKMIRSLSRKLKAEICISNESGTAVYLTLGRYKLVV